MLIAVVENGTDSRHDNFLARSHIGRTADDVQRVPSLLIRDSTLCLSRTDIDFRDMQVVGVGVCHTGQHFAHHKAFQTAFDSLYFLNSPDLQTDRGKDFGYGICVIRQIDVAFQPIIGNIHSDCITLLLVNISSVPAAQAKAIHKVKPRKNQGNHKENEGRIQECDRGHYCI